MTTIEYVTLPGHLYAAMRAGAMGEAAAYCQAHGHADAAARLRAYSAELHTDAMRGRAAMTRAITVPLAVTEEPTR